MNITTRSTTLLFIIFISSLHFFTGCSHSREQSSEATEMKRATVPGGELEYEVQGNGEPVLFIHGAHIADSFLPLMNESALAEYRLIRYHRRGHMGSTPPEGSFSIEQEAADALALLRHLEVEQAHIVGYSSGGVIAIQLALDAPEVTQSLVLIEPALMPDAASFSDWVMPIVERYQAGDTSGAVNQFMKLGGGEDWKTEVQQTVPGGPQQAVKDAKAFFEVEVPAMLQWNWNDEKAAQISQPILYINQSGSEWEGKERLVKSWFPDAEYYFVEHVNHLLPMQAPQSVAAGIIDFLNHHPL